MSSVPDQEGSPAEPPVRRPGNRPPLRSLPQLRKLRSLLRAVKEEPEVLDASNESAHRLVRETWYALFGEQGMLKAPDYQPSRKLLQDAWDDENDWHEAYAYGLEIYEKRQKRDLDVEEAIKDKRALAAGRRQYISRLRAFYEAASGLEHFLNEPSLPS
jgi:hypothetical protein